MQKITVAIIDPEKQTIEVEQIENTYEAFAKTIGGNVEFKRLKLPALAEVLENYDEKETVYAHGTNFIDGINIAVHGFGVVNGLASFMLGKSEYTVCHGKAIISGADDEWEDVSIPYVPEFFEKIISWL